jgi:hypothetical protein
VRVYESDREKDLDIADIWSIAGIGFQNIVERLMQWAS